MPRIARYFAAGLSLVCWTFAAQGVAEVPSYLGPFPLTAIGSLGQTADGRGIAVNGFKVADMNGDGFDDVVATRSVIGPLFVNGPALPPLILLNDKSGSFLDGTSQLIAAPIPKYFVVRDIIIEDFNGDGQPDIFFSNHGYEEIAPGNTGFDCEKNGLLLSGADGKLHDVSATHLPGLTDFSHGSSAADIDGDGDIDVLSASTTDNKIAWYENDGSQSFTPHTITTSADGAASVYAVDIDGDGDMDVLSASQLDDKIAWYENLSPVGIGSISNEIPIKFRLSQNYPNPFNPSTSIQYAVSSRQFVSLKVYDVLGNEVATLVNEEKPAGSYKVEFDGTDLTSGIYFYKLQARIFAETKKMILLK